MTEGWAWIQPNRKPGARIFEKELTEMTFSILTGEEGERRRWGLGVIQKVVDLVGDEQEIVPMGKIDQLLATHLGQGKPTGVLEGGDGVQEFWLVMG